MGRPVNSIAACNARLASSKNRTVTGRPFPTRPETIRGDKLEPGDIVEHEGKSLVIRERDPEKIAVGQHRSAGGVDRLLADRRQLRRVPADAVVIDRAASR